MPSVTNKCKIRGRESKFQTWEEYVTSRHLSIWCVTSWWYICMQARSASEPLCMCVCVAVGNFVYCRCRVTTCGPTKPCGGWFESNQIHFCCGLASSFWFTIWFCGRLGKSACGTLSCHLQFWELCGLECPNSSIGVLVDCYEIVVEAAFWWVCQPKQFPTNCISFDVTFPCCQLVER